MKQKTVASKDSPRPASRNLGSLRYMYRYLKPYKSAIAMALVVLVFASSAVLGLGAALRYMVDEGIAKGDPHLLDRAYYQLLGVTVLLAGATYARFYLVTWVGERAVSDIRRDLYHHLIAMDVRYYETTRVGEVLSILTTDTTLLQSVIGSSVSIALRNSLLICGGLTLLLITSPKLTIYMLLILPAVIVPIIFIGRKVRQLSRSTQERVADISAHTEETVSGIRTIQALALEPYEKQKLELELHRLQETALQRIRMRSMLTAIVICLVFGAIVTVLWIGGRDVMAGHLSAGDLSAFVFYAVVVAGAVGALSEVMGDLQRAAGASERIHEMLAEMPLIRAPETPAPLPEPVQGKIAFETVTFHYPSRPDSPSLRDVSLTVEPGELVALVGPSGAGKSTFFQLLLRFYDPEAGQITFDGMDIRQLDPETLRHQIGLVPQDPVIFSANAWDNIRCGNPKASDEEVLKAAEAASAREFLEALPQGFDTFLGEKGIRLSGGQKQRIAIARAIIRNPRILLLDEATSALDSRSEQQVQAALDTVMKGRTTLVIAHRLSTVRHARRIVLVNEGRIEAIGTHDELMESSPLYARLAQIQLTHQPDNET
jgi:ATP-binding cassette subfamily B protein